MVQYSSFAHQNINSYMVLVFSSLHYFQVVRQWEYNEKHIDKAKKTKVKADEIGYNLVMKKVQMEN